MREIHNKRIERKRKRKRKGEREKEIKGERVGRAFILHFPKDKMPH